MLATELNYSGSDDATRRFSIGGNLPVSQIAHRHVVVQNERSYDLADRGFFECVRDG